MDITHRHQILFVLVLHHGRNQIVHTACLAEEHLALAILHILLDIQGDSLCDTEILHILRNSDTQLLGHIKEMVNGMT